ncbi:MAG TPA: hypothetical protein VJR89_14825 [Polyangiales bacterium]|nr:hypothetical protein [Polyangiales bacterium]
MQPKLDRDHLRRKASSRLRKLGDHNERITKHFAGLWSDYADQMLGHASGALKHGRLSPSELLRDTFAASVEAVGSAVELYGALWKECLDPSHEPESGVCVLEFDIDTQSETAPALPIGNATGADFATLQASDLSGPNGAKIPKEYIRFWKLGAEQVGATPSGLGPLQPLPVGVYSGTITSAGHVLAAITVTVREHI